MKNLFMKARYYPFYLLLLCAALFLLRLGTRDFWAPVEPRYAEIARVMFTRGEWIVPTVNGELYTDKPILYFWLILVTSKIAGVVNEWTVRLPVALAGMGFVLVTYYLGRDLFSVRIGFLGAAILATTVRVIWEARWAHIDVLFCFVFLLSVYCAARALLKKGHPNEILIAYVFMGLATLAKGLIGVVLPALLLIGFVIARRDWQMISALKLHWGIPLYFLVVAPWVCMVNSATGGKWLSDFVYIHHFQRYTAGVGHRQPFYYYLKTLPVDFLPWTIFAIPAFVAYRPYRHLWTEPRKLFLVMWFFVVFLFFSASDTKRELYLMPLLPTLALFTGHYFDDLAAGRLPQDSLYRSASLAFYALIAITGLVLPPAVWLLRRDVFWISFPVAGVLVGASVIAIYLIRRNKPLKLFAATTLMMVIIVLSTVIWIIPLIEPFKSRRFFSLEVQRVVPTNAALYIYADIMDDFNYYMHREVIPVLRSPDELQKLLAEQTDAYILIKAKDLKSVGAIPPARVRITGTVGSTLWNLVALGSSRAES